MQLEQKWLLVFVTILSIVLLVLTLIQDCGLVLKIFLTSFSISMLMLVGKLIKLNNHG